MKLAIPKCPECGESAVGTCDVIKGLAQFDGAFDDKGNVEYGGYTEVDWDSQRFDLGDNGKPVVQCSNYHTWETDIDD